MNEVRENSLVEPPIKRVRRTHSVVCNTAVQENIKSADTTDENYFYSNIVEKKFHPVANSLPVSSGEITRSTKLQSTNASCKWRAEASSDQTDNQSNTHEVELPLKDPTPPPSPSAILHKKKKATKVKKGVQQSMRKLEKLQKDFVHISDELSTSRPDPDLVLLDDDADLEYPQLGRETAGEKSMLVRVRCTGGGIRRYNVKRTENFSKVLTNIAETKDVSISSVMLLYNDSTLHSYDTPISINLKPGSILDCHIRRAVTDQLYSTSAVPEVVTSELDISLNVQFGNSVKSSIVIRKDDVMGKLMEKFCQQHDIRYGTVAFKFDGEILDLNATPISLELEDGFCIDVSRIR